MNKILHFFRHGETDWNSIGRIQGHSDIPLNAKGIDQALGLTNYFHKIKPDIFLSSDLARAIKTARLANSILQRPHFIEPRLREIFLGEAEGKTLPEVTEKWGIEAIQQWQSSNYENDNFSFPKGESKFESVNRVKTYLETLMCEISYENIAFCGHGGILKRFCQLITEDRLHEFPIPNCCIYKFNFNTSNFKWTLLSLD